MYSFFTFKNYSKQIKLIKIILLIVFIKEIIFFLLESGHIDNICEFNLNNNLILKQNYPSNREPPKHLIFYLI